MEGRVEIQHNGVWGTVCDDGWSQADAQIVCNQLGFLGTASATQGGQFGLGEGTVFLCERVLASLVCCLHSTKLHADMDG